MRCRISSIGGLECAVGSMDLSNQRRAKCVSMKRTEILASFGFRGYLGLGTWGIAGAGPQDHFSVSDHYHWKSELRVHGA